MIEVPSDFLNVVFMLLIVFASVNRSKQRSAGGNGVRTLIHEHPAACIPRGPCPSRGGLAHPAGALPIPRPRSLGS